MKTSVDDYVILFFSGHGTTYNQDFYYPTYFTEKSTLGTDGLSFQDIIGIIDSIPARKKLVMIDACHSGEVYDMDFLSDSLQLSLSQEQKECLKNMRNNSSLANKGLIFRGDTTISYRPGSEYKPNLCDSILKSINIFAITDKYEELFVDLSGASGAVVLTAARGNEFAAEDSKIGNGAFTHFFKECITNFNSNPDKKELTTLDMLSYIKENIRHSVYKAQTPTMKYGRAELDFAIFKQ
jgi:hypothetical protein